MSKDCRPHPRQLLVTDIAVPWTADAGAPITIWVAAPPGSLAFTCVTAVWKAEITLSIFVIAFDGSTV